MSTENVHRPFRRPRATSSRRTSKTVSAPKPSAGYHPCRCGPERRRAVDPDRGGKGRQGDRTWSATVTPQRDRDKRREESPFDSLADAPAADKFVELVPWAARRTAEVDEVLRRHNVAAEDPRGDRVKEEATRTEWTFQVEHQRGPKVFAGKSVEPAFPTNSAHCQVRAELVTAERESGGPIEPERCATLAQRQRGNRWLEAPTRRSSVDDKRIVTLVRELEGRTPAQSRQRRGERNAANVVGIGVIAPEFLRRDGVADQRSLLIVAHIPVLSLGGENERGAGSGSVFDRATPFGFLVAEAVAPRCGYREAAAEALKKAAAERETFDPIESGDVGDVPRREGEAAAASERLSADKGARFVLNLLHILVGDRAHIGRK